MLITGYHGTSEMYAHSILSEGKYNISGSNTEWLGNGIYFYECFSDALNWKCKHGEVKTVLHSVIQITDDAYLDIDSPAGEKVWRDILDYICKATNIKLTGTEQEQQCAACRILWDTNPSIMVIAGSFPTEPSQARVLIDKRIRRREFCVRNNEPIKCTQIIDYRG